MLKDILSYSKLVMRVETMRDLVNYDQ